MKIVKIFVLILLFGLLIFCSFKIASNMKEEQEAEEIKEKLIEIVDIPDEPIEDTSFKIDFDELKQINSDVVGWILIKGTSVNYPIVQGKNNSYYLNHSYDKKWNGAGSIFMDYNSSSNFMDYNTFIYGHHTRNGTMFGELYNYMNYEFYKDHSIIYIYTPEGNYQAEIFSAYIDSTESNSYNQNYSDLGEYIEYINLVKSKSKYNTNIEINPQVDKIITLYSCSHETHRQKTDRYFIHAVLRSI